MTADRPKKMADWQYGKSGDSVLGQSESAVGLEGAGDGTSHPAALLLFFCAAEAPLSKVRPTGFRG